MSKLNEEIRMECLREFGSGILGKELRPHIQRLFLSGH